jgi:hypothetical protein
MCLYRLVPGNKEKNVTITARTGKHLPTISESEVEVSAFPTGEMLRKHRKAGI